MKAVWADYAPQTALPGPSPEAAAGWSRCRSTCGRASGSSPAATAPPSSSISGWTKAAGSTSRSTGWSRAARTIRSATTSCAATAATTAVLLRALVPAELRRLAAACTPRARQQLRRLAAVRRPSRVDVPRGSGPALQQPVDRSAPRTVSAAADRSAAAAALRRPLGLLIAAGRCKFPASNQPGGMSQAEAFDRHHRLRPFPRLPARHRAGRGHRDQLVDARAPRDFRALHLQPRMGRGRAVVRQVLRPGDAQGFRHHRPAGGLLAAVPLLVVLRQQEEQDQDREGPQGQDASARRNGRTPPRSTCAAGSTTSTASG